MNLAKRCWPILALACCLIAFQSSYSQAPTSKRQPATVTGKVTIKAKGAPGVAIGLRRMESNSILELAARGVTDQDGNYRINVAEGSYDVRIVAPAFVAADPFQARKIIMVNPGENVDGIDFALVRGGVITGQVTDADGRPVIQQQVNAYRAESWERSGPPPGQPVTPTNNVYTDDRGIYRMFGLPGGRYKVAVGRGDDSFPQPQQSGRATYQRVFHPDVTEPVKAAIVEVSEGSEATNIDISIGRPVENYTVSGRLIDGEKGLPVPAIRLALERISSERFQNFSNFVVANAQGDFVFDNVSPGKYYASIMSEPGREFYAQRLLFEVTDRDVTGLVLKLTKGAIISGFVTLESEDPKAFAKLREVELGVFVSPPTSGFGGRSASSTIGTDGNFRVAGLPSGIASAFISGGRSRPGPVKGFTVTRIERDGVPQPARGFEVQEGEQVTGVRIVVSYGDGVLRGRITGENGKLLPDSHFSVRISRPGGTPNQAGFTQGDARGNFIFEGLSTGIYDLFVTVVSPGRRVRPPLKQEVSVTSGTTTEVIITVPEEPKPPQP
jgi:hypothetical protein